MSGAPLASIIVITYNNADTIEECLQSLVSQTYPEKEIIVVYDEGSKDGTRDVLDRLLKTHEGILRVVSVPHMGRSKARNVGWRNSMGEFIFFADADDVYYKEYLEKAISQLGPDRGMGCVCLTGSSLTSGSGFTAGCMDVYSKLQQVKVERGAFRPSWAWVYRREALEKVGGFDESLDQAEDKDLFIRVKAAGYSVGLVTGLNWFHRRPANLWSYLRKCYLGGMRRISFIKKHGRWHELELEFLPFFILVALVALSLFSTFAFLLIVTLLATFITLNTARLIELVWDRVKSKRYIFLYPIFGLITYLFSSVGHIHGLALLVLNKVKRLVGLGKI